MLTFLFLFVLICVFSSWPGPQEKNTKHKTANEQCEKCRQIKYFQARNLSAWQVKEKKKNRRRFEPEVGTTTTKSLWQVSQAFGASKGSAPAIISIPV